MASRTTKSFKISHIRSGKVSLEINPPLEVTPTFHEDDDLFYYDNPELGIYCVGESEAALKEEIEIDISFSWMEYVRSDISELHPKAQQFRKALLLRIREAE